MAGLMQFLDKAKSFEKTLPSVSKVEFGEFKAPNNEPDDALLL
jgi:hypothetical protein